jgi:hypothetical protein
MTLDPPGLHLRGGVELATRRPYPNKGLAVACRRHRTRKAISGILIETARPTGELVYTARWAVHAELLVTHRVIYRLLDDDFDAASDDMMLWYAGSPESGGWSSRWPAWAEGLAPVHAQPLMRILPVHSAHEADQKTRTIDKTDSQGWIVERHQVFAMPTIERERITRNDFKEIPWPPLETAFRV